MGNARSFFEGHLMGLFRWDSVKHQAPDLLPALDGGRRNPLGKFREQIVLTFGIFELSVHSPEDDPPLGWIVCRDMQTDERCEGPPDHLIWENIAKFIKERVSNG